jgi:hypothetical protein
MSSNHDPTRALAAGLAVAALAASPALGDNLRSTDARDPATAQARQRTDVVTGGVRAPDQRRRHARDAPAPVTPAATVRTPATPTVVEIKPARGFDWTSAAIGAASAIALALIAIAAMAAVSSRPTPH